MEKTARPRKVTLATGALRRLGALGALAVAAMITAPVALGQPSPDPAPVAPTLAPDPAPAAATPPSSSPPSSSPPATEAPAASAPATPAPTTPTAAPQQSAAATADASAGRSAKQDRPRPKAEKKESDGDQAEALPRRIAPDAAFLKVTSLLPNSDDRDDSSSSMLFFAAAALLVLAIASGSFASVLARLMPPAVLLLVLLAAPATASAESLSVSCATPASEDGCNTWYSSPSVTLQWTWSPNAGAVISGCDNDTFTSEGQRTRTCRVEWAASNTVINKPIWIGIDRTAPQISGLQPARPADFGSWFNHPVTLSFKGSDSLSGVASCTSLTYSGPEGAGAPVNGTCADVAGNTRSSQQTVNYDATAPPKPDVVATPRDGEVRIEWTPAVDAQAEVMRMNGGGAALVYSGTGHSFTDDKLKNDERYRYVVSLIDQAGNRASAGASAVPTASPLLTPSARARLSSPPLLTWRKVRRASYYNVQLLRGKHKILSRWPRTNELQLKRRWRFAGRSRRLVAGRYCWYVWPGYGARAKRNYGRLLGKRCFTVTRRIG